MPSRNTPDPGERGVAVVGGGLVVGALEKDTEQQHAVDETPITTLDISPSARDFSPSSCS